MHELDGQEVDVLVLEHEGVQPVGIRVPVGRRAGQGLIIINGNECIDSIICPRSSNLQN